MCVCVCVWQSCGRAEVLVAVSFPTKFKPATCLLIAAVELQIIVTML